MKPRMGRRAGAGPSLELNFATSVRNCSIEGISGGSAITATSLPYQDHQGRSGAASGTRGKVSELWSFTKNFIYPLTSE